MLKSIFKSKISIFTGLLMVMVCFATNSVITRYLVLSHHISPFTLTIIRFVSGLLMLQVLTWFMPKTFPGPKTKKSYVLGAVFLGIYAFSISYGYFFISTAAGVLIFYTFVVLIMTLFSVVSDKEKLTHDLIFGQILAILGVLVIAFSGIKSVTLTGVILMAITGISWGIYSVYGRRFENYFGYTYNSFLIFGIAGLVLFSIVYFFSDLKLWTNISMSNLGWALYLGMISTALSYILWHKVMKKIEAYQAGIVQLMVPIITGVMGILFLDEKCTLSLIGGGSLILVGIFLNIKKEKKYKIKSKVENK